ncbi:MAG: hypothetical protein SA339_01540 [Methanomassiliicoccus sp.]|nr:hypothetical protein [Methanomassiliicoccus sp.]
MAADEQKVEPPMEVEHRGKVWKGAPNVLQRCSFCNLHKECKEAHVKRGSRACAEARYAAGSSARGIR